ncbi:MAG: CPBP family glutamic-type intramembrane protease [Dehalococcoidia bacterium]
MTTERREALILIAGGVLGSVLVFPYILATTTLPAGISRETFIGAQLAQNVILVSVAVIVGLWCARRVGLGAPILEGWLRGEPVGARLRSVLPLAVGLGAASAVLILALEATVFRGVIPVDSGLAAPPAWTGFLASFYGGITEEILLRLLLMSLLAWVLIRAMPRDAALWTAILVSTVLFGLGHLPATAQLVPLTAVVVTRAVVLNGVAGVAFGWLYWKRGLESAMIAHFAADLVLHVAVPAFA